MHEKTSGEVSFNCGCLLDTDYVYVVEKLDDLDDQEDDIIHSRLSMYDAQDPEPWGYHDLEWDVCSVCYRLKTPKDPGTCFALSKDGDVEGMNTDRVWNERIPGAGLGDDKAVGRGYVNRIREIGGHLWVCGSNGQVYRRDEQGWVYLGEGFALDESKMPSDQTEAVYAMLDQVGEELMFFDINGTSETDVYVCGADGKLFHWDGKAWMPLKTGTLADLNEIHVASPDEIWICADKGLVFRGNAQDGFEKLVVGVNDGIEFTSIHQFQGKVYLAGDYEKLYTLEVDEETGKLEARWMVIMRGLIPGLQDTHQLDSVDGVLWSIGIKDLAFFDGKKWTRVENPDNPKIGMM